MTWEVYVDTGVQWCDAYQRSKLFSLNIKATTWYSCPHDKWLSDLVCCGLLRLINFLKISSFIYFCVVWSEVLWLCCLFQVPSFRRICFHCLRVQKCATAIDRKLTCRSWAEVPRRKKVDGHFTKNVGKNIEKETAMFIHVVIYNVLVLIIG